MKRGRPKKPPAERRDVVLCARITKAEYRDLFDAAKRAGLPVREHVRKILCEAKP